MQSVGVAQCRGCGVCRLWSVGVVVCGVAVCGGYSVWGFNCVWSHFGELWGVYKLNFHSKSKIFCFLFCNFANLTLEFCYDQTNDPRTLRIVLKDAYLY